MFVQLRNGLKWAVCIRSLLSDMEFLNGIIQQIIRQNAAVTQGQTEYNICFDAFIQKFKETESTKGAAAQ